MWQAKLVKGLIKTGSVKPFDKLKITVEFENPSNGDNFEKEYQMSVVDVNSVDDFKLLIAEDLRLLEKAQSLQDEINALELDKIDFSIITKPIIP